MDDETLAASAEELLGRLDWIRALAGRLVADPATADDLAQETLVASLGRGEPRRAWLARVLRSRARDRRASERARSERERRVARLEGVDAADTASLRLERQRLVVEALQALEEPLRTTTVLRWIEELPAAEVARRLGVPAGTVRWRSARALERLREILDQRHGGDRRTWVTALSPLALPQSSSSSIAGLATWMGSIVGLKTLALTGAAAAVALVMWIARDSAPELEAPGVAPTQVAAEPMKRSVEAVAGREATSAPPAAGAERERAVAAEPRRPRLAGRVLWPAGSAADPELEVHALIDPVSYGTFAEAVSRAPWDEDHRQWLEAARLARSPVGADGGFTLVLPAGCGEVQLMLLGRFAYLPESIAASSGEAPLLEPTIGAHVSGRVLVPRGFGVEGVRVELERAAELGRQKDYEVAMETDREGRFAVGAVPTGEPASLVALPKKLAALLEVLDLTPGQELVVELPLAPGGGVTGRVTDEDGRPVPGGLVGAQLGTGPFGSAGLEVREAQVDRDGVFLLTALPVGPLVLRAECDGWLEGRRETVEVPASGTREGVQLSLSRGRSVTGHARWPDGRPAARAKVEVSFDPAWGVGTTGFNALRGASGAATTDERGAFAVTGLGAGPFVVLASAASTGDADDAILHSARRDGVRPDGPELELVLRPPLTLEGRVVDSKGHALPGATVRAVRVVDGELGPTATATHTATADDPTGHFAMTDLEEGPWRVTAESAGAITLEPLALELPRAAPIVVTLELASTAAGRVLDADGSPVPGATVRLSLGRTRLQRRASGLPPEPEVRTDEDGRFELAALPPGERTLEAEAPGWVASGPVSVSLPAGGRADGVDLVLGRGAALTGEVWDAGEPGAGRMVQLVQFSAQSLEALEARTDEAGTFRYDVVPPGTWVVLALDPDRDLTPGEDGESLAGVMGAMEFTQVVLEAGETTHVVLGSRPVEPVEVYGRVRAAGEPQEVLLSFHASGGRFHAGAVSTVTSDDGTYRATLPKPGTWTVTVQEISADPQQQRFLEYQREIPAGGANVDLDLPTGSLSGVIVGPGGAPAVGAPVLVVPAELPMSDSLWGGQLAALTADDQGRFEVRYLAPGTYVVAAGGSRVVGPAAVPRYGRVTATLELGLGQARDDVRLELPEPGAVLVTVRGPDGAPVEGATVFARDSNGAPVDGFSMVVTDASGVATYDGLSPGAVTFSARSRDMAAADGEPVEVRSGTTARAGLKLVPATVLWIRTRGSDGPLPARVSITDEGGRELAVLFGRDDLAWLQEADDLDPAEVRCGPLPPGRYRLRATGEGGLEASKRVTLEGEAARRVVLRLR